MDFSKKLEKHVESAKKLTKRLAGALLFFAIAAAALWLLFQVLLYFFGFDIVVFIKNSPVYPLFEYVLHQIESESIEGVFYLFSVSSLFFIPVPLELLYIAHLHISLWDLIIFATLGMAIGQIVNYILGRFFSPLFRSYVTKKKRMWVKQKLKKYGVAMIFLFNFTPLPFPLFNFMVGISRYPFWRFCVIMILGLLCKSVLISILFG